MAVILILNKGLYGFKAPQIIACKVSKFNSLPHNPDF